MDHPVLQAGPHLDVISNSGGCHPPVGAFDAPQVRHALGPDRMRQLLKSAVTTAEPVGAVTPLGFLGFGLGVGDAHERLLGLALGSRTVSRRQDQRYRGQNDRGRCCHHNPDRPGAQHSGRVPLCDMFADHAGKRNCRHSPTWRSPVSKGLQVFSASGRTRFFTIQHSWFWWCREAAPTHAALACRP